MLVNIEANVNFQFGLLQPLIIKTSEGENVLNQLSKDKFFIPKNRKVFVKVCIDVLIKVLLNREKISSVVSEAMFKH